MRTGRIRRERCFREVFLELRKAYAERSTEHSGRTALENFLNAVAAQGAPKVRIQQEPLRQGDKDAPDFKVSYAGMILGYVENKPIDTHLNKVLKSEQIKKYLEPLPEAGWDVAVLCCATGLWPT